MIQAEHLNLQQVQLKRGERWTQDSHGLFFAFGAQGQGVSLSRNSSVSVGKGDVLVGSNRSAIIAATTAAFAFWIFSVCLEQLLPLFAAGEISLVDSLLERLKHGRRIVAGSHLAAECHQLRAQVSGQDSLGRRAQLLQIAAVALNDELRALQPAPNRLDPLGQHLVRGFARLSTDEFLRLSVGELASRFGCSRRHLNRLFHQCFNMSVVGLRMEMRLLKAVSLLRDPEAKVINVAAECGFNHLGLFNTCFRKRFGASPSEWRKCGRGSVAGRLIGGIAGAQREFANTVSEWLPADVRAAVAANVQGKKRRNTNGRTMIPLSSWEQLPLAMGAHASVTVVPPALATAGSGLKLTVSPPEMSSPAEQSG